MKCRVRENEGGDGYGEKGLSFKESQIKISIRVV